MAIHEALKALPTLVLALSLLLGQAPPPHQTPETLCYCTVEESNRSGSIETWEDFRALYGPRFKSEEEGRFAWRVYSSVNRCNSAMVIGRLADTAGYLGNGNHCVLRNIEPWSVLINDVFIQAGIDRGARFLMASQIPFETLAAGDPLKGLQVEPDRETDWRIIYNHEIAQILDSGLYLMAGRSDEISPESKAYLVLNSHNSACVSLAGRWTGSLIVREVRGASSIRVGQRRDIAVDVIQGECEIVLKMSGHEISGTLLPGPSATAILSDNPTGTLISAEIQILTAPGLEGQIDLEIVQRTSSAWIHSAGRLSRQNDGGRGQSLTPPFRPRGNGQRPGNFITAGGNLKRWCLWGATVAQHLQRGETSQEWWERIVRHILGNERYYPGVRAAFQAGLNGGDCSRY